MSHPFPSSPSNILLTTCTPDNPSPSSFFSSAYGADRLARKTRACEKIRVVVSVYKNEKERWILGVEKVTAKPYIIGRLPSVNNLW